MESSTVKQTLPEGGLPAPEHAGTDCVTCPYCGGRAWFASPVPDEAPCSCQACGGTGVVPAEH